jgi:hypothetical protein
MSEMGLKYDAEKTPLHLLPVDALWSVGHILDYGQKKYTTKTNNGAWNWYKGIQFSRLFSACLRHLWKWWRKEECDPESGMPHLAHAACCLLMLLQFSLESRYDLDDRPQWKSGWWLK